MEVSVEETYWDPEELTFRSEGHRKPVMGCCQKTGKSRCNGPEAYLTEKWREARRAYRRISWGSSPRVWNGCGNVSSRHLSGPSWAASGRSDFSCTKHMWGSQLILVECRIEWFSACFAKLNTSALAIIGQCRQGSACIKQFQRSTFGLWDSQG